MTERSKKTRRDQDVTRSAESVSPPKADRLESALPRTAAPKSVAPEHSASRLIDERIRELGGWKGKTLARMRALIREADPEVIEETKWGGTPVWSHHGIVCTGESYAKVVKLTFAHGASLDDPRRLFNASLEGQTRRAIDLREGESVDAGAFRSLVKAAVAQNASRAQRKPPRAMKSGAKGSEAAKTEAAKSKAVKSKAVKSNSAKTEMVKSKAVNLLSGGNPQIAKGDGDAPVQAYIAAMPGWKREMGERLDALIERAVPAVKKAVKWNSPFYGIEGQGWFLSTHVFTRYVKVTFFRGTSLRPLPPGGTERSQEARWIDVHEGEFDEAQLTAWVKQAAALPGWVP